MKFCRNCGQEINEDIKFCPKCGTQQKESRKRSTISNNKTNLIIISVIIIVISSSGLLFWQKDHLLGLFTSDGSKIETDTAIKSKQSVFPFKNGDRMGLMNDEFEIIQEEIGTFVTKFNKHGVAVVYDYDEDNQSAFIINEKGEVLSRKYSSLGTTEVQSKNGILDFQTADSNVGLINSKGEVVKEASPIQINPFNSKQIATFYSKSREKEGVISENGDILVEPMYDTITIIDENKFAVKHDSEDRGYQIINAKGEKKSEDILGTSLYEFTNGDFVLENLNGKYSVLDNKLNVVIDSLFNSFPYYASKDGQYFVVYDEDSKEYMLYDRTGKELVPHGYTSLGLPDNNGNIPYMINKEYGLVNLKGEYIFQDYSSSSDSSQSFNRIGQTDLYVLKIDGKATYYNKKGEKIFTNDSYNDTGSMYPIDYVSLYSNGDSEDESFTVMDQVGNILSENAVFVTDDENRIIVQEDDQYVRFFSKKDGSEIRSEWLEFDPIYLEATSNEE